MYKRLDAYLGSVDNCFFGCKCRSLYQFFRLDSSNRSHYSPRSADATKSLGSYDTTKSLGVNKFPVHWAGFGMTAVGVLPRNYRKSLANARNASRSAAKLLLVATVESTS